jgi:hypothetical protein
MFRHSAPSFAGTFPLSAFLHRPSVPSEDLALALEERHLDQSVVWLAETKNSLAGGAQEQQFVEKFSADSKPAWTRHERLHIAE